MKNLIPHLVLSICILSFGHIAQSQAPSANDMIQQLKAKPAHAAPAAADTPAAPMGTGRTRSLGGTRNLSVESATPQEVAATNPPVAVVAERASLSLQIQFDFNSARVKPESGQALTNLATALLSKELQAAKFSIEGHTDSKGGADYNQRLSQQRADAVREFLVSKGVDSTRLSSAGKGASDPANKDDPLAAENRRVKIVNLQ